MIIAMVIGLLSRDFPTSLSAWMERPAFRIRWSSTAIIGRPAAP
jgi:hypothetical protein